MTVSAAPRPHVDLQNAVVRFAGDSGDGMQLTGTEFTHEAALYGNDLATFPDYPAEIRAPAGTTAGVSGYQIQFAAHEVYSAGDQPARLGAMNPAALKVPLPDLKRGGLLILNEATFKQSDLDRAGWKTNPLTDGTLENYQVIKVDFEHLVGKAVEGTGVSAKDASRCKNFYALGLVFWIYSRDIEREEQAIRERFKKSPPLAEANVRAFKAGYNYGETIEALDAPYSIERARDRAQDGSDGPRLDDRAAAGDHQRAARRAVDRATHQDGAVGPLPGGLWTQRRVPDPGARRPFPSRLFRHRLRSLPHRHRLPHAGHPPLGRVAGERQRAVAPSGREQPAEDRSGLRHRSGRVHAVQARRQTCPALGHSGYPRTRAPHRWPGEGCAHRQHQLRRAQSREDGAHARGEGPPHRRPAGADGTFLRPRRGRAGDRMGRDVRIDHAGGDRGAPDRAEGGPRPPAACLPAAERPDGHRGALPERAGSRAEHGPAALPPARSARARVGGPEQDPGQAVPRRRGPLGHRIARAAQAPARGTGDRLDVRSSRKADEKGLRLRSGGEVVPGMRRFRHPGRRAEADARAGHLPGEDGLHQRDRLRFPVPLLHEHVRLSRDPRPRPGHRHRPEDGESGPDRLGGDG